MATRIILFISLCCFLFIACGKEAVKEKKSVLFWGFAVDGFPVTQEALVNIQKETQQIPQILTCYLQWPKEPKNTDLIAGFATSLNTVWEFGGVFCLTWEPFYFEGQSKAIPYQEILEGKYDVYLQSISHVAKEFGKPFLIRFAHEMNLKQYHWGTDEAEYGPKSGEIYQKLFRYVVDFFRKESVANVLWVFCPNCDSVPNEAWNRIAHYYPGESYVDVFGLDGYSWSADKVRSFQEIFNQSYLELKMLDENIPIFIFETAIAGDQNQKAKWVEKAIETALDWSIEGIVWFQVDKEKNWKMLAKEADFSSIQKAADLKNLPDLKSWAANQLD